MGKRAFPAFASTSLFDFCDLSDAQELAGIKTLDLCYIRVSCSDLHPWHGSNRPPNGMVTSPASLQPPNCRTSSLSEEPLDIRMLGKRKHVMTLWSSYVLPADTISHGCRKRCGGQAFLLLFLVLDGYRLVLLRLPEILAVGSHPTVHIWNRHKKSNQNRRLHTNSHHDPIKITCASPAASCLWASHFSFFLTLPFNPPATKEYNPKLMLPMDLTAVLKTFLGNFKGFLLYYFISGMYIIYLGTQRKMIQSVNRPCLAGGFQSTLLSTPDTLNKVRSQWFERISNGQSCGFHWKCGRYPQHRNFDGKTIIHQILGNKRLLSDAECVWPPLCRCQTRPLYTLHTLEFVQMGTPFEKSGRNLSSHPRVLDSNTDIVPVTKTLGLKENMTHHRQIQLCYVSYVNIDSHYQLAQELIFCPYSRIAWNLLLNDLQDLRRFFNMVDPTKNVFFSTKADYSEVFLGGTYWGYLLPNAPVALIQDRSSFDDQIDSGGAQMLCPACPTLVDSSKFRCTEQIPKSCFEKSPRSEVSPWWRDISSCWQQILAFPRLQQVVLLNGRGDPYGNSKRNLVDLDGKWWKVIRNVGNEPSLETGWVQELFSQNRGWSHFGGQIQYCHTWGEWTFTTPTTPTTPSHFWCPPGVKRPMAPTDERPKGLRERDAFLRRQDSQLLDLGNSWWIHGRFMVDSWGIQMEHSWDIRG